MSGVSAGAELGAIETLRRGVRHSPELTVGIRLTLVLAILASAGQVVVPIAVQQTLDKGIGAEGGPDLGFTFAALLNSVGKIAAISSRTWSAAPGEKRSFGR